MMLDRKLTFWRQQVIVNNGSDYSIVYGTSVRRVKINSVELLTVERRKNMGQLTMVNHKLLVGLNHSLPVLTDYGTGFMGLFNGKYTGSPSS
jgi:hypothetical protein